MGENRVQGSQLAMRVLIEIVNVELRRWQTDAMAIMDVISEVDSGLKSQPVLWSLMLGQRKVVLSSERVG